MDKYKRYRQKCLDEGRCPHCGKPCAPFTECDERRAKKRLCYILNKLVLAGSIAKVGRGTFEKTYNGSPLRPLRCVSYKENDNDRRKLPRIGKKYIDTDKIFKEVLEPINKPFTKKEIINLVYQHVSKLKIGHRKTLD